MKTKILKDVPVWAFDYLFDDDDTNLSQAEIYQIENYLHKHNVGKPIYIAPNSRVHYTTTPAFGFASNVQDIVCPEHKPKNKSRKSKKYKDNE